MIEIGNTHNHHKRKASAHKEISRLPTEKIQNKPKNADKGKGPVSSNGMSRFICQTVDATLRQPNQQRKYRDQYKFDQVFRDGSDEFHNLHGEMVKYSEIQNPKLLEIVCMSTFVRSQVQYIIGRYFL